MRVLQRVRALCRSYSTASANASYWRHCAPVRSRVHHSPGPRRSCRFVPRPAMLGRERRLMGSFHRTRVDFASSPQGVLTFDYRGGQGTSCDTWGHPCVHHVIYVHNIYSSRHGNTQDSHQNASDDHDTDGHSAITTTERGRKESRRVYG